MPDMQGPKYASIEFAKRETVGHRRHSMKEQKKKWRINWSFIIVWIFIFIFCGVCWYGVYKFVKLIAKGMGWLL